MKTNPTGTEQPPIVEGTTLGLDIDGVLCPISRAFGVTMDPLPEKFIRGRDRAPGNGVVGDKSMGWHPLMRDWLTELDHAFDNVVWITSWRCARDDLLDAIGVVPRRPWVKGGKSDIGVDVAIDRHVARGVPFAGVDDDFFGWSGSRAWVDAREGATLTIQPAKHVGISREIVDTLLRFAEIPEAPEFRDRSLRVFHHRAKDQRGMFSINSSGINWRNGDSEDPEPIDDEELRMIRHAKPLPCGDAAT